MPKKILFIGAGASFGARISHNKRPPLGIELCNWLRQQITILLSDLYLMELHFTIEQAKNVLDKHSDEHNFEALVARIDRDERVALQRLLQICFSDLSKRGKTGIDIGFNTKEDSYDKLIDYLNEGSGDWTVVSLNYDILFEEAMRRKGLEIQYPHFPFALGQDQSTEPGVRIYKPHGSINFFAKPDIRIFHHEPTPEDDRGTPTSYDWDEYGHPSPAYPIIFAGLPGAANVLTMATSSSTVTLVMANYTKGKKSDANLRTLELVRRDALALTKDASELLIIGVRPIQQEGDDYFVQEMLGLPTGTYTYVTKGDEDANLIKTLHSHAKVHRDGLIDFLESRLTPSESS